MAKGKGGGFEREMCRRISLWVTNNIRDDIFWRTPGSGAMATTRMKSKKKTAGAVGDMAAKDLFGKPYTDNTIWEFKRGYGGVGRKRPSSDNVEFLNVLDNPRKQKTEPIFKQWWIKLSNEKIAFDKRFAFIIFKRDRKDPLISMEHETYEYITAKNNLCDRNIFFLSFDGLNIIALRLDDFLEWCDPRITFSGLRIIKRRRLKK